MFRPDPDYIYHPDKLSWIQDAKMDVYNVVRYLGSIWFYYKVDRFFMKFIVWNLRVIMKLLNFYMRDKYGSFYEDLKGGRK